MIPNFLYEFTERSPSGFYGSVFFALWLSGLGFPISADLVLLLCGYLAFKGQADLKILIPLCVSAIMLTDSTMFYISSKFGDSLLKTRFFQWIIPPDRLVHAQNFYRRYGYRMIFIARFLPGVRTAFVFVSGLLRLNYLKFLAHDFAGGIIMIPFTLCAVSMFSGHYELLKGNLENYGWLLPTSVAALITVWLLKRRYFTQ